MTKEWFGRTKKNKGKTNTVDSRWIHSGMTENPGFLIRSGMTEKDRGMTGKDRRMTKKGRTGRERGRRPLGQRDALGMTEEAWE